MVREPRAPVPAVLDEDRRGRRRRAWRRALVALAISAIVHLPLTPITLLFGFLLRVADAHDARHEDYPEEMATVPIELVELPPSAPAPADGIVALPADEAPAAEVAHAEPAPSEPLPEAPEPAPDPDAPGTPDPSEDDAELDGAFGLSPGQPNVAIELYLASVRSGAIASALRPLLACGHLGAATRRAGVDPLEDLDGVLLSGPRLDGASAYTIALAHHLGPERVARALASLAAPGVTAPGTARIRAAGARIVVARGPRLLLATPEAVWNKLRAIPAKLAMPPARGRAFAIVLRDPAVALRRLGIHVPASLERLRVEVRAPDAGRVRVRVRFDDRDEAAAAADARDVATEARELVLELRSVSALAGALAPLTGLDLGIDVPRLDFAAEGKSIAADLDVSEAGVVELVRKIGPAICAAQTHLDEGP